MKKEANVFHFHILHAHTHVYYLIYLKKKINGIFCHLFKAKQKGLQFFISHLALHRAPQ